MNEDDRYHLDMERLTRAEQRAEQLRGQLLDTESKMADIEAKLEQIEYAMKPENIDRATQGYGSRVRKKRVRRGDVNSRTNEPVARAVQAARDEQGAFGNGRCAMLTTEVDLLRAKLQQRRDQMDRKPPTNEKPRNVVLSRKPE